MPAASSISAQTILLPDIPELFEDAFLDILLPASVGSTADAPAVTSPAGNPMVDALIASSFQTFTENGALAYNSTDSPILDAFNNLSDHTVGSDIASYLSDAWEQDPGLTLRLIWNLRSIPDGKGYKEIFYRAFGWLYDNHPRTAISNLHLLVEPVCLSDKEGKSPKAHGSWKDLLNILCLATLDDLTVSSSLIFLHAPRMPRHKIASRRYKEIKKTETPAEAIERSKIEGQKRKVIAREVRTERLTRHYQVLVNKLRQPKYRALYIAIARLFADQLIKDIRTLHQIQSLEPATVPLELMKKISLAGKWAPTPGASHDRVTNIATTISHIIHASQVITPYPSALNGPISPHERSVILRSFYQRWVLTELRQISACPESLMATNRWIEIKYSRVPSICMNKNRTVFFSHDPNGFEKYMVKVESGRKPISGAAMLPHELVAQIMALKSRTESKFSKMPAVVEVRKALAEINTRVIEAQWKTLIESLREAGSLDNCIAVCDVSGSMGSIIDRGYKKSDYVAPILPAVSLSLVLATLAKPPFNAGFISFSARPEFVRINLKASLADQVNSIVRGPMGFNTNFKAVFINLLLPLAVNNKIKQEDMVKRLFVFSDMQFDESEETSVFSDMQCDESEGTQKSWETTYDLIEDAYKKAGYEVPQIVFWDLNASSRPKTVEVKSDRKGVAMMNGFSPALLKVFMGEREQEVEVSEWEEVSADGTVTVNVEKEEFNPINVMKKVLLGKSFDGLVVVD